MKAGYISQNRVGEKDNFVLVSNYSAQNGVTNVGFIRKETFLIFKDYFDIGFWRVKRK